MKTGTGLHTEFGQQMLVEYPENISMMWDVASLCVQPGAAGDITTSLRNLLIFSVFLALHRCGVDFQLTFLLVLVLVLVGEEQAGRTVLDTQKIVQ